MELTAITIPDRLRPTKINRSGNYYHNFQEEKLQITLEEKTWLFQEVLHLNDVRNGEFDEQEFSKSALGKRYGLHKNFFNRHSFDNYRNHGIINLKGQKSFELLPEQIHNIQLTVAAKQQSGAAVSTSMLHGLIVQGIIETSKKKKRFVTRFQWIRQEENEASHQSIWHYSQYTSKYPSCSAASL